MPRDGKTDQASERSPRDPGSANIGLALSGDFQSPQQVLAETALDPSEKRAIFDVWLRDLQARTDAEARELLAEVREAIAVLERGG